MKIFVHVPFSSFPGQVVWNSVFVILQIKSSCYFCLVLLVILGLSCILFLSSPTLFSLCPVGIFRLDLVVVLPWPVVHCSFVPSCWYSCLVLVDISWLFSSCLPGDSSPVLLVILVLPCWSYMSYLAAYSWPALVVSLVLSFCHSC